MSQAAPPVLTVRYDGSQRTFAAGHDVVVGRDLRADMRITHPLISRAHLLLRFEQGRWVAIDNGSLNGTFVNGRRAPVVDIHDGQAINIGNPDGPQLTFEIGRAQGNIGRPPQTTSMPIANPSAPPRPAHAQQPPSRPPVGLRPQGPPRRALPSPRDPSSAGTAAAVRATTAAGLSARRPAAAGLSAERSPAAAAAPATTTASPTATATATATGAELRAED